MGRCEPNQGGDACVHGAVYDELAVGALFKPICPRHLPLYLDVPSLSRFGAMWIAARLIYKIILPMYTMLTLSGLSGVQGYK